MDSFRIEGNEECCETGKKQDIPLHKLASVFHLPIVEASEELGMCATALKKICRRHNLTRWPHRKLKSIDSAIERIKVQLKTDPKNKNRLEERLQELNQQKLDIMLAPSQASKPTSMKEARAAKRAELAPIFGVPYQEPEPYSPASNESGDSYATEPYYPTYQAPVYYSETNTAWPSRPFGFCYPVQ